jgi:hypothetical protein
MELTSKQITLLNLVIPKGFRIETVAKKTAKPRRTEADTLSFDAFNNPSGKRPVRERKPVVYEEPEPKKL